MLSFLLGPRAAGRGGDKKAAGERVKFKNRCSLKVPKRENFSLAFFAQSEPIWVCDLGSGEKNMYAYNAFFEKNLSFGSFMNV